MYAMSVRPIKKEWYTCFNDTPHQSKEEAMNASNIILLHSGFILCDDMEKFHYLQLLI